MVNGKPNLTFGDGRLPTPNIQRRAAAPQLAGMAPAAADFAAVLSRAAPNLQGGQQAGTPQSSAETDAPQSSAQAGVASTANISTPPQRASVSERLRRISTPITGRGNFEMIDTRHGPGSNLPALNVPERRSGMPSREALNRVLEQSDKPLAVVDSLPEEAKQAFKAPKVLTPPSRRAKAQGEVFSFNSPFSVGPSSDELVSIFYQVNARRPDSGPGTTPSMLGAPGLTSGGRELGGLSARYESGEEGIAAVGWDRHGGTSYGKYQISSRAGTMKRFLDYLDTRAPDLSKRLRAAGPANTGGRSGAMPRVWKQIAEEDPTRFEALQSDFIRDSHYEPALEAMAGSAGLSYAGIPPALQEVLFSTAVQHGPAGAASIISRAVAKVGADRLRPDAGEDAVTQASRELIQEIYTARAGKFGSSTREVRSAVQQRLKQEMRDALAMLE